MTGTKRIVACAAVASLALGLGVVGLADAKVKGVCSNCHTMHNSQNGAPVVSAGSGAQWSGGKLIGGSSTTPQQRLTTTDCVGCHSSAGAETIVTIGAGSGESKVPIVYNMTEPKYPGYADGVYGVATTVLAGGNFFWVANGNGTAPKDSLGHNVGGISAKDAALAAAPGAPAAHCNQCHSTLTGSDYVSGSRTYYNGCRGCHQFPMHHANDPAGTVIGVNTWDQANDNYYRFLSGPHGNFYGFEGVSGIEDGNWEQNASAVTHNVYNGGNGVALDPQSMGRFCAGCHVQFHSPGVPFTAGGFNGLDNGGDKVGNSGEPGASIGGNPWLRHPTDVVIPDGGEYGNNVIDTAYEPNVPVATKKEDLLPDTVIVPKATIQSTDRVFCLSCHRPHGSPFPDMLRWDYTSMNAHSYTTSTNNGCFKCHTTKDDK